MTKKAIQEGEVLDYVCTGTVTAGDVVLMGHTVGIALTSGVSGDTIAVGVDGVFEVPKTTGSAWVQGNKLLWDVSATKFDVYGATPAAGDVMGAAVVAAAATSGATTGYVLLTPGNATLS